ncbi:hypothetical protein ACIRU8_29965 [Streptomyces sp. NPDC101175]|uniref:hypothetical protein n=1 Tax=Streptomyces sp. NPDC101175 TaxID=3366123 RepID=UPI003838FD44
MSIWRTWQDGEDKITGKALAFGPSEEVRKHDRATELRRAYDQLRESDPSLGLTAASSKDKAVEAMQAWELANRDRLTEAEVEDTHFFGFAGQSRLAQLIDFVFVSADLRAYEETDDQKATALGRILDGFVDKQVIRSRTEGTLGGALAEGFFAHAVVLVEGRGDEGRITGCAERSGINLGADGIAPPHP